MCESHRVFLCPKALGMVPWAAFASPRQGLDPLNPVGNGCQKETPAGSRGHVLTVPWLLVVGDASIGQALMNVANHFFSAGVVVPAAIGQLNARFGWGLWSRVRTASVKKSSHRIVPQIIPSPRSVAWSVCAPAYRGERFVAVATDRSYARVKPMNVRDNLASSPAQACRYLSLLSQVPDGMRHLLKPYSNSPKFLKKQYSTKNVDYSRKV